MTAVVGIGAMYCIIWLLLLLLGLSTASYGCNCCLVCYCCHYMAAIVVGARYCIICLLLMLLLGLGTALHDCYCWYWGQLLHYMTAIVVIGAKYCIIWLLLLLLGPTTALHDCYCCYWGQLLHHMAVIDVVIDAKYYTIWHYIFVSQCLTVNNLKTMCNTFVESAKVCTTFNSLQYKLRCNVTFQT